MVIAVTAGSFPSRETQTSWSASHWCVLCKSSQEVFMITSLSKETNPGLHLVEFDKMFERMQNTYEAIAKRAYKLFEDRGRIPGFDLDDWFKAESELFRFVPISITDQDHQLILKAEVPGFSEKELNVAVEPGRVVITGKTETEEERKEGKTLYSERRKGEIFRDICLPAAIDPEKVEATLKNGTLELTLPKVAKKEGTKVAVKAA
jgi:HSP20 family protein